MRLHEIEQDETTRMLFHRNFRISGDYIIENNGLITVEGSCRLERNCLKLPVNFNSVSGNFICYNKELTTLEGCPNQVGKDFDCSYNELISLEGCPDYVGGDFDCTNNNLTSLIGAPKIIEVCRINGNQLTSLEGLPKEIKLLLNLDYHENLPLLKLCFSKIADFYFQSPNLKLEELCRDIEHILKKYNGTGRKGALQCAAELTKAGYKGNARL